MVGINGVGIRWNALNILNRKLRVHFCLFPPDGSSYEIVVWLIFLTVHLIGEPEVRVRSGCLSQTEYWCPRREASVAKNKCTELHKNTFQQA